MNEKTRKKGYVDTCPRVVPAGQRDDLPKALNMPCPDDHSLEEEYRWRQTHIQ